jgi:hypothetical protein
MHLGKRAASTHAPRDLALGKEWAILELLSLGLGTDEAQTEFTNLIRSDINWGELVEQALRHRVWLLLAYESTRLHVREAAPVEVEMMFQSLLGFNRHKLALFRREASRIVHALERRNVRCAGTKGIALESLLYHDGCRYMGDLDFMVCPEDTDTVIETMTELGYYAGYYDWQAGELAPHSRKEAILYKLHPDHIPPFAIQTGDPVIPDVRVDFATSLTWTNSGYHMPVNEALMTLEAQILPGQGGALLPCLTPVFQFAFTALHLYREAWLARAFAIRKDVNLAKFADVLRLWMNYEGILIDRLPSSLEAYGIVDPVLWVVVHADRTWGTTMAKSLGLEDRVSEDWLSSAHNPGGGVRRWTGTMRERLHSKDRRSLFLDAL